MQKTFYELFLNGQWEIFLSLRFYIPLYDIRPPPSWNISAMSCNVNNFHGEQSSRNTSCKRNFCWNLEIQLKRLRAFSSQRSRKGYLWSIILRSKLPHFSIFVINAWKVFPIFKMEKLRSRMFIWQFSWKIVKNAMTVPCLHLSAKF